MASSKETVVTHGSKQLKVDNWGTFFLQRLQMLYEKNENCDIILQFHEGGEIKVHRLVLMTCTDYFQTLTVAPDNRLVLPPVLKYSSVRPIVNFMYTGRLDFKYENHQDLLKTAKLLSMTILVKLLVAQVKNDDKSRPSALSSKPILKGVSKKGTPLTPETPTTTLPGKKLPFWKKRTTPGHLPDEFYQSDVIQPSRSVPTEPAKPTRFEWPEEEDCKPSLVSLYSPSFDSISYDSELLVKPIKRPLTSDNQESSQDQDNQDSQAQSNLAITDKIKRFKPSFNVENCFGLESDDDDDDDGHFESVHNHDDDDDYDDEVNNKEHIANGQVDTIGERNKTVNEIFEAVANPNNIAISSGTTKSSIVNPAVSTPKPILKPLTSDVTSTPNQSKKVRFSLSPEGKENSNKKVDKQIANQNNIVPPSQIETEKVVPAAPPSNKSNGNNSPNHAKIIAEVLKKYPELVKNNKNIRLKIMSPNNKIGVPKTLPTTLPINKTAAAKSKVSYVVMKSEIPVNNQSSQQEETTIPPASSSGAENTTGPWFCHTCGTNNEPLNFDTYYLYRRHLQDVHMERIDARICEHCGCKSSKRNLHLYHLYTKHNIPPPRNINFPKCDQCEYIALSDSLLIKHRNNHVGVSKDYVCKVCNSGFRSHGALQGHMQTSLHSDSTNKEYQCDYCDKTFNRNINLKAHIRTAHKDESRKLYDEEDPTPQQNLLQVIQVPVIDSLQSNIKGQQTLLLPAGMTILAESPAVPFHQLPSSESEALSNVASGIATSLNLNESNIMSDQTVIFLDSNSELLFDQSGNPIVMAETTVVTDGSASGEYIIPEMISGGSSISTVFTTQAQPVVTTSATQVVPVSMCSRSQIQQLQQHQQSSRDIVSAVPEASSTDHTYADESVQQSEETVENSLQAASAVENDNINVSNPSAHNNIQTQKILKTEGSLIDEACIVDNDELTTGGGETIHFATANEVSNAAKTQLMEVCERDSIIIQPASEMIHEDLSGTTTEQGSPHDVQNVTHTDDENLSCMNSNSVVVNSAVPSLVVNTKVHPKDDLVRDWDDFGEDDEVSNGCSLNEIEGNEQADDIKPSRPTIELEESILPDM